MADAVAAILAASQNLPKQQTPVEVLSGWQDLTNKSLQGDYTQQAIQNAALENKRNTLSFNQTQADYLGRQIGSQLSQLDDAQNRKAYEKLIADAHANGMIDDAHVTSALGQLPPEGSPAESFKRFGTRLLIGSLAGPEVANRVLPNAVRIDRGPDIVGGTQAAPNAGANAGVLDVQGRPVVTKGVGPQMIDTGSGPQPTNAGVPTGPIIGNTLTPQQAMEPETRIVNGVAVTRPRGDWIQDQYRPQGYRSPDGAPPPNPLGSGRNAPPAVTPVPAVPVTPAPAPNLMDPPAPPSRPAPPGASGLQPAPASPPPPAPVTPAPPAPVVAPPVASDGGLGGKPNVVNTTQTADREAYEQALKDVPNHTQQVHNLQTIQSALGNIASGKGIEALANLRALYVTTKGALGINTGSTGNADKDYAIAKKYLTEYMRSSGNAGGSNAQLEASAGSNASTEINHEAAMEVVGNNLAKERLAIAVPQEAPEKNGGTGYLNHAATLPGKIDQNAFKIDSWTPKQYQDYVRSLKDDKARAAFAKGLAVAKRQFGIVPPIAAPGKQSFLIQPQNMLQMPGDATNALQG